MENTPGLFPHDGEMGRRIGQTYPGQASWAGGGPEGKTCGDCALYGGMMHTGYYDDDEPRLTERRHRCFKYYQLMRKVSSYSLPARAAACRYFEAKL